MQDTQQVFVMIPAKFEERDGQWWAMSLKLGLCVHGDTRAAAEQRLDEAFQMWVEAAPDHAAALDHLKAIGLRTVEIPEEEPETTITASRLELAVA